MPRGHYNEIQNAKRGILQGIKKMAWCWNNCCNWPPDGKNMKIPRRITDLYNKPVPQPVTPSVSAPTGPQVTVPETDWGFWVRVGATTTAVLIVGGTLVEDVLSVGAGIADDPASFAAAAALGKIALGY